MGSDATAAVYSAFGLDVQEYRSKLTAPGVSGRASAPRASEAERAAGPVGAAGGAVQGGSALGKEILTTRSNDASGRTGPSQGREPVQSGTAVIPSEDASTSETDRRMNMIHALAAARRNVAKINEGRNDGDKRFDKINICGRPHDKHARIEYSKDIRSGEITGVWTRGLLECELAWLCPQCGAKEGWRQEQMIRDAIVGYQTFGPEYEALFMTLTATHAPWRSLEDMLGAVTKGYTELVTNSRLWKGLRKDGTIYGWIRALEITYSTKVEDRPDGKKRDKRGWHPHVHVLVFVKDRAAFMEAWNRKETGIPYEWNRVLNKVTAHLEHPDEPGKKRPIGCHPGRQDIRPADLDDAAQISGYVTKGRSKWDIAKEVARGDLKTAARTSTTPQEMLLRSGRNEQMAKLWQEYALATSGVHAITQSRMQVDGKRWNVGEYLAEIGRKHRAEEQRKKELAEFWEKERAFEAQQESWDALSDEEQEELIRRQEDAEAAKLAAIPMVQTALRVHPDMLKEWKATPNFVEQLQRVRQIIREEGVDAGIAYASEAGLPFTKSALMKGTTTRGAELREYRAERSEFVERQRARLREELYGFRDGDADVIERKVEEIAFQMIGRAPSSPGSRSMRSARRQVERLCATYAGATTEFIEERVEELLREKVEQFDVQRKPVTRFRQPRVPKNAWEVYRDSLVKDGLAQDEIEDELAVFSEEYGRLLNEEKLPRHEVEEQMGSWVRERTRGEASTDTEQRRDRNDDGVSAVPSRRRRNAPSRIDDDEEF